MAGEEATVSYELRSSSTTAVIIVVFISVAFYNVLELLTLTFTTFRRYTGLYFWAFLVATCGIAFNGTGYLLKHLSLTPIKDLYATIILIGWCTMITGQSLVLYSRLHLVMQQRQWLRAVLWMIIFNAIWLHVPIIILVYGINSSGGDRFLGPYSVYEKIQLTVFFVQECIISGIYVWRTTKILQMEKTIGNVNTRRTMNHLIYVNLIIILLDVTILALEYSNNFDIQTAWKPLVYSVKLKLEFSILNKLKDLVRRPGPGSHQYGSKVPSRGVPLETFGGGKSLMRREGEQFNAAGYSTHVGRGDMSDRFQNNGVLKTTEVTIHTDERQNGSDVDADADAVSMDRKSGMTTESVAPVLQDRRDQADSSPSSKVYFARSRM